MATARTKSDALAYFLSDPPGLGGGRSAVEFEALEPVVLAAIPPIIIERLSPACGSGRATITAGPDNTLCFAAPGEAAGTYVTVAANSRVLLESESPEKSVRVYRDSIYSAADLGGLMLLDLVAGMNNAIGLENITTAGVVAYGCLWIYNHSPNEITDIEVTPGANFTVAFEEPVGGRCEETANATDAPGVTFASSASLASLAPGAARLLRFKRTVGAGTVNAVVNASIEIEFVYDAETYTDTLAGSYRVADSSLARYELFVGEDEDPDFLAAPAAVGPLPLSAPLAPGHTHRFAVRLRNEFDLSSFNTLLESKVIDGDGEEVVTILTDPQVVSMVCGPGGTVELRVRYSDTVDLISADTWRVYATDDGTDPDPEAATPIDTQMVQFGLARPQLETTLRIGPYAYGATAKAIVRVYSTELEEESQSDTVHELAITTQVPVGAHRLGVSMGGFFGATPMVQERTTFYNAPTNTVGLRALTGEVVFFGVDEIFRGELNTLRLFRTSLEFHVIPQGAAGAPTPIEVISASEIFINVATVRRAKIDMVNGRIEASSFEFGVAPVELPAIGPIHITQTATYIMVRHGVTGRWTPAIQVDADGVFTAYAPVLQEVA